MNNPKITRFMPHGPTDTGLVEWFKIDPSGLDAGNPVQTAYIYHENEAAGYLTGVWDCTPMTIKFGPYGEHEFMFMLEGSLTMILTDGTEVTINAGESCVIPKGLPCQWKQPGYLRKFFMIFENPGAPADKNVSSQGIILPQPLGELKEVEIADPSSYVGDLPRQCNNICFEDPSGRMVVGLWDSTPFERVVSRSSRNELMCLIEGSVTATDDDGGEHHFQAGDVVYVPKGAVCGWKTTEYVRTLYSIYAPSNADTV